MLIFAISSHRKCLEGLAITAVSVAASGYMDEWITKIDDWIAKIKE
jgi:hypothetical protein